MKAPALAMFAIAAATPVLAQETRQLDAHVHGVSALQLAVENGVLEMNLLAPGMDIVGFEYAASTDADKDVVEAAIRALLVPENVVTLPEAAECRLTEVLAHLHGAEAGHEHGEDEHDHAEGEHEHEDHEDHEEHDHAEGSKHTEFHARYIFACEHPEKLTTFGFPFFDRFANAQEIEAQYVTDAGAGAVEIGRDAPELKLD